VAVHDGSTTASTAAQLRQSGRGGRKGLLLLQPVEAVGKGGTSCGRGGGGGETRGGRAAVATV
jgi:hypothetical protein